MLKFYMIPLMKRIIDWWKIESEYVCHVILISRLIIIWRWSEPRNHHWAMILVFDMFSTKWWFLGSDHRQIIIRRDIDIAWQAYSNSIFSWVSVNYHWSGPKKQTPGKLWKRCRLEESGISLIFNIVLTSTHAYLMSGASFTSNDYGTDN